MADINLSTFPSSPSEALAMLHLEKQDIKDAKPEDLAQMYFDVRKRIENELIRLRKEARLQR